MKIWKVYDSEWGEDEEAFYYLNKDDAQKDYDSRVSLYNKRHNTIWDVSHMEEIEVIV